MSFTVETVSVDGGATALGSAGTATLVIDRPVGAGGRGIGFNGGQLLYLAVAGCISNDLYREAQAAGIALRRVRITAHGDFTGAPPVSTDIAYEVEIDGDAPESALRDLVARVDEIAEIPNSLRRGTPVRLTGTTVGHG